MWHELNERMTKMDSKNTNPEENKQPSDSSHARPEGRGENSILHTLPDSEYAALQPHLEFVEFSMHQVLQEPGEKIEFGYFINSGLVSLLVVTSDARSVEVGIVGKEGFVGAPLAMGLRDSSQRALIQIKGSALRIKADSLRSVLAEALALRNRIGRYVLLQGLQVAQLAACNRLHEVEQRLARWLLMTHDRTAGDSLPITHDLLAQMLGSGRPSVTLAAGMLQRAGTIGYTRGQITVLDRDALERTACECYGAIRRIVNGSFEP
jgi:CRP-like cAMP-binding protein